MRFKSNCCQLVKIDQQKLHQKLESDLAFANLPQKFSASHPKLFAARPIYLPPKQINKIESIIRAIHRVIATDAYRQKIVSWIPPIARIEQATQGVFFGYDFHLTAEGPKIIEINTNAGGALLNAYLAKAQLACCKIVERRIEMFTAPDELESLYLQMFQSEWQQIYPGRKLQSVAIVDAEPEHQGMYPEFLLFQKMFESRGIQTWLLDPGQQLHFEGNPIDLVYNRHCDFYFQNPEMHVLKEAYQKNYAIISPHPRAYALYADKRNLTLLSDMNWLKEAGIDMESRKLCAQAIPTTVRVTSENQDELWSRRKLYYFKPFTGYGSKAVYKGSKLTKKVWGRIVSGDYLAQQYVKPGEIQITNHENGSKMKMDLRAYVYDQKIQLLCARLYRGQTTNMNTPGGGFAPVFSDRLN